MTNKFDIEMYADTACPWCYIGKRGLDNAMATYRVRHPEAEFRVSWKPYILYPMARRTSYTKKAFITSIVGPERAPVLFARLAQLAAQHDLPPLRWDGPIGNTMDSHKLIMLARKLDITTPSSSSSSSSSLQNTTVDTVFHGIFAENRDISDRGFLVEVALANGLAPSETEVLAWLDGDEASRLVGVQAALARTIDITAVPSFVVQGRYRVGGRQDAEVFLELFDRIREREEVKGGEE
ncbi:thioredoxin-like protein [Bombardia bombarda]|uniref:Thioredoxin-like protein n=1 Tax=Bombardia bombarda TaxID=252184 RepID=A0AA39X7M1_9PEZI|nr:thioredoxin-like protein [Bombardia bombarda]